MSVGTLSTQLKSPRWVGKQLLAHVAIIALGLVMIYPALWMLSSSFKPGQLIFSQPGLWPREFTLDNWAQGWVGLGIPFSRFFLNSAVVTGALRIYTGSLNEGSPHFHCHLLPRLPVMPNNAIGWNAFGLSELARRGEVRANPREVERVLEAVRERSTLSV
jgi:hypothetical protein